MSQASAGADQVPSIRFIGPISILSFLSSFELECDTNGVYEGASFWLLYFFMRLPAAAALNARIALRLKSPERQTEGTIRLHFKAINNLLKSYAKDDMITETDADMKQFTQLSKTLPTVCAEALFNNIFRWNMVHDQYGLNGIFIECLREFICRNMHTYCRSEKTATVRYPSTTEHTQYRSSPSSPQAGQPTRKYRTSWR